MSDSRILSHAELLQLKRWNTPTIFNGWEQITRRDHCRDAVNLEETRDFMPQMGPMVGYAVTLKVEPSNPAHRKQRPNAVSEYRRYLASVPGPKIVVIQDLDKPAVGRKVQPGDLIHADKHGFLVLTGDEHSEILEAARFMDTNECETVIQAARSTAGLTMEQILQQLGDASKQFQQNAREKFRRGGEW